MKQLVKTLLAAFLLVALLVSFAACPAEETPPPAPGQTRPEGALTFDLVKRGTYTCRETGITYNRAPDVYLPGRMSNSPYAVCETEGGTFDCFYKMGDDSAEQYLVQANPDTKYPGRFFIAEDYEMPTLPEMDPDEVWICGAEATRFWAEANIYDRVLYSNEVDAIVAAWGGAQADLPTGEPEICVQLIFRSPFYTEFFYYCTYYSFGDEGCYLYEAATGHCTNVPSDLFDDYKMTDEV